MPPPSYLTESQQVFTQLPRTLVEAVDRRASKEASSRSAVVREAVAAYVVDEVEDERARRDHRGYTALPEDTADDDVASRQATERLLDAADLPW